MGLLDRLLRPNIGTMERLRAHKNIKGLIRVLGYQRDATVRRLAAEILGELAAETLGESTDIRAVEPLINALQDKDQSVRNAAIEALGKFGDSRAIEPLVHAFKNELSYFNRYIAVEALRKIKDPRVITPLCDALTTKGSGVCGYAVDGLRMRAAEVLRSPEAPRVIESLSHVVEDQDQGEEVRAAAVDALRAIGDSRVAALFIAALKDKEPNVRARAADALGYLKDVKTIEPLIQALEYSVGYPLERVSYTLKGLGEQAVVNLNQALMSDNRDLRSRAAWVLGQIQLDARLVEPLIEALGDRDERVRDGAMMILARLKDPRAIEPLINELKKSYTASAGRVALALIEMGDKRAVPYLVEMVQNTRIYSSGVHALSTNIYHAIRVLGELGDSSLIPMLEDLELQIRQRGIEKKYVSTEVARGEISTESDIAGIVLAIKKLKER